LGFFAATKSPAKTDPRLAACSGGPAEKQLLGICAYLTFRTQLASFSTVRSGKSLTRLFVRPHLSPAGLFVPPAAGIIISPSFFATDATRNPNGTIGDGGRQTTTHRRSDERRPCYGRTDRMTLVENGQRRTRRTNATVEARTDRCRHRRRLGHRDTNECEAGHLVCFVFMPIINKPKQGYNTLLFLRGSDSKCRQCCKWTRIENRPASSPSLCRSASLHGPEPRKNRNHAPRCRQQSGARSRTIQSVLRFQTKPFLYVLPRSLFHLLLSSSRCHRRTMRLLLSLPE
jgi:hypothetical protein